MGRRFHELHSVSRERLTRELLAIEAQGMSKAEWVSSTDPAVCRHCRSRHGKTFTIYAAQHLLEKDYCCSTTGGYQRSGCRCSWRGVEATRRSVIEAAKEARDAERQRRYAVEAEHSRYRVMQAEGRARMLDRLAEMESEGDSRVEWSSSNDQATCAECRARDGKVFAIAEARRLLLDGKYCCAVDEDSEGEEMRTHCRCLLRGVMERDPGPISETPSEQEIEAMLSAARGRDDPLSRIIVDALAERGPPADPQPEPEVSREAVEAEMDAAAVQFMRAAVKGIERVDDATAARAILEQPGAMRRLAGLTTPDIWSHLHAALQRISVRPPQPPPDAAAAIDRENAKAREREVAEESDLDRARRFLG